jgi:hypothetical protein
MLEVIDKGVVSQLHPAPLLFIRGAWHAAWCWDENFMDFFADRGLSGHRREPARPRWKHLIEAAELGHLR